MQAAWPPLLEVHVKANRFYDTERIFFVRYNLLPHAELDKAKFCLTHKCAKPCAGCDRASPRTGSKKQKTTKTEAIDALLAEAIPDKSTFECKWFLKGLCRRAREDAHCPFKHASTAPGVIQCALPCTKVSHMCSNGARCLYRHDKAEQRPMQRDTPEKDADVGGKRRMVPRTLNP